MLAKIFNNARKPEGFLGKLMVLGMNSGSHTALAKWAFEVISVPSKGQLLDIGCGGGANVARLLKFGPNCEVTGIDYSPVSVAKTAKVNAAAVKAGRCSVKEANVLSMPFGDHTFQLVTAFETVYFWPEIERSLAEVMRVMAPGATFVIVNEGDGVGNANDKWEKIISGMHTYTAEELQVLLQRVGFQEIVVRRMESQHWLMVTAVKPQA